MKRFAIAVALAFVLSVSVFAGEIPSDGFASPLPTAPTQSAPGEVPSVGAAQPISGFAVTLIQDMVGWLAM